MKASCHDPRTFDGYIRERFLRGPKKTEAIKAVEQFAKDGVSLSEAVLLAIEALTPRESRELRFIVDQFHQWCEWQETWEPRGWKIRSASINTGSGTVARPAVMMPPDVGKKLLATREYLGIDDFPPRHLVAAAAGVAAVTYESFVGSPGTPSYGLTFETK